MKGVPSRSINFESRIAISSSFQERYQDGQKEEHHGLAGGVVGVPLVTRLSRGNGGSRGARAGMFKGQLRVSGPVIDSPGMVPTWQCHGSGKQSAPARPAVNDDARSASRQPTAHHCCPSEANSWSCSVTLIIRLVGRLLHHERPAVVKKEGRAVVPGQLHPTHPPLIHRTFFKQPDPSAVRTYPKQTFNQT
jgi:hypothetical protein